MNLFNFLVNSAEKYPDKTAFVCEERRLTYLQLKNRAEKLASSLYELGIRKGMKAGILLYNSVEYVEIIFALMKLGAVGVPLNIRLTKTEIKKQADHSDVSILFLERELAEKAPFDLSFIKHFVMICPDSCKKSILYESLFEIAEGCDVLEAIIEDDESFIIYTAGTTANPKGVVLTHGNQIANTQNYSKALNMSKEDIEFAPTPLFHCSTLGRVFTYVCNGMTFLLCRKFDPESVLEIIEREKVTAVTQAPTLYQMLAEVHKKTAYDTGSVKRVVTGASVMSLEAKKELKLIFSKASCYDLYGATEASPGISILCPSDFKKKMGSVGKAMDNVEVKIDAEEGIGEILCRGPNVMKGYYKDPKATEGALKHGWFHTGDMGRIDEDGFLFIEGRKREIIITGGINVYPAEIESVIITHSQVYDVSVIGVSDPKWGEKIVAAIVPAPDVIFIEESLKVFCKERLADFKCPREFFIVKELPRNAAQKIMKNELQVLYQKRAENLE